MKSVHKPKIDEWKAGKEDAMFWNAQHTAEHNGVLKHHQSD